MVDHQKHHRVKRTLHLSLIISAGASMLVAVILAVALMLAFRWIEDNRDRNQQDATSNVNTILDTQEVFALPDGTSNVPDDLDPATILNVVAKNQPAVVRVVTVYCADLTLRYEAYSYDIDDACNGGVGSGSFISSDGYIATNGHVVTISNTQALAGSLDSVEAVDRFIDFALIAQLLSPRDGAAIVSGVRLGEESAYSALEQLLGELPAGTVSASGQSTTYGIQLGNDPMRVTTKDGRLAVEYSETVIDATLVDIDFDSETAERGLTSGEFTSSDVALLKAEGAFPYVTLGDIDDVAVGEQLTAVGFPALVDEGLDTDQWQTVPSITQGRIQDIVSDANTNGRDIVVSDVQIAQGSSGGPAFNDAGVQIGLNTYGEFACRSECFGDAYIRDAGDVLALVQRNNITLKQDGITPLWEQALADYTQGNYADALEGFTAVSEQYPANYLVSPLARSAREYVGTSSDTSTAFQVTTVVAIVYGILAAVTLIIVLTIVGLIIYFTHRHKRAVAREASTQES